ncbi:MAG: LuxR C-terminal-related transcriptional regulator [Anaerolineae bacterium]|nr:LuxR C-terminal-related transcriptional regulator [Anaerolineae bacterium]
MSAPILATKLYIPPPRPGLVSRLRLVVRLNEGLATGRKLTLISASAGSGKTTLLSEWIALPPRPVGDGPGVRACWLSIDETDSDPGRFLAYFIAALQTAAPNLGAGALAALQTPQLPPLVPILTSLLNEIGACPEHLVLVLDDYHAIDSPEIDAVLTFLIDHLPPQLHIVISSREDPNLPLARLRVRGQLSELRAADLRFTPIEAAEFLNQVMGLNLSEADVTTLEARTEGWIAGLQLAALAMQAEKDTAGFIQAFTGSHRFVLDYLLEEVLQRQPPDIQDFLLRTSILNRLCGPLCDAVLDALPGSGQETLESLEQANLFIIPLDNERRWYRYHHLFADLLLQRLGNPPDFPELHLRASQWYENHGDLAEAFHHAHVAGDSERAGGLAEAAWPVMADSFQSAAWVGWVKKLPEMVVLARPELCHQLGRAFSDLGEPETSEFHLQNAERALDRVPSQAGFAPLSGNIALTRAYNAQVQGILTDTVKYAELALQLIPEDDVYHRAQAVITLEFTHWASGDLESSLHAIRAWMADMHKIGNPVFAIASAFAEADLLVILGRLHEAIRAYQQALKLATEHGAEAQQITAHHHLGLALIYHELGDSESTAMHLQTAADLGKRTTLVDWLHRWKLAQARFKESAGEWEAALELLEEAKRGYVKNPVPITHPVETLKARIYLKQGRLDKAREWVKERGDSIPDEVSYVAEFDMLTLVRVLLAEGSFNGVDDLLERLRTLAEAQNRMGSVLEILLTEALAHQAQGHALQALAAIERALTLAKPEGYLRTFVNEGEAMRLLVSDFRRKMDGHSHPLLAYADKLLAAFGSPSDSSITTPQSQLPDSLTPRELEILRLVAQGLSNTEISQRLYLALSTVKGHNLRIFDKLQVQNRTEAVARARELRLL